MPRHALSQAECAQVLCVANEPRFADMPPARIVPMLADEVVYIARVVSDDNAFVESLFRTAKYRPELPTRASPAWAPRVAWRVSSCIGTTTTIGRAASTV